MSIYKNICGMISLLGLPIIGLAQVVADSANVDEVVVSATRTTKRKSDTPIPVFLITSKTLHGLQATSLSEGLSYAPGIRMETDCQTCNYTQVRMNGLAGSYTQILINGRALFSSLMGLYGLEQIPANAIERVEIVRGSGSVLYGSNAIAGTINVITKQPAANTINYQQSITFLGMKALDAVEQLNGTFRSRSKKSGWTYFVSQRNRAALDINADGFSELPRLKGTSVGLTYDQQFSARWKLQANTWLLSENRRGGDQLQVAPDVATQSEFRKQVSLISQLSVNGESRSKKMHWNMYGGLQQTRRLHYTGIDHADGWGSTRSFTLQSGVQMDYKHGFRNGKMEWNFGLEQLLDQVFDAIPGYHYLVDQRIVQYALFIQHSWEISSKWTVLSGIRWNRHSRLTQVVTTPRLALLYKPNGQWQIRTSYGRGFKAPQAFETDMHMAFSGGGVSTVQLDPGLQSEYSDAFAASADWNRRRKKSLFSFTVSGFYTQLLHPFVLSEIGQDSLGNTSLLRTNGDAAWVKGFSGEFRWRWYKYAQTDAGCTIQRSTYRTAPVWSDAVVPTRSFLRTPNVYGYLTVTLFPDEKWSGNVNVVYTGKMLVPHFGGAPEQAVDVLVTSTDFVDCSVNVQRNWHLHKREQNVQLTFGMNNLFNAFQSDFDTTKNRDSNYIYGPAKPRSLQLSLKWKMGERHSN